MTGSLFEFVHRAPEVTGIHFSTFQRPRHKHETIHAKKQWKGLLSSIRSRHISRISCADWIEGEQAPYCQLLTRQVILIVRSC